MKTSAPEKNKLTDIDSLVINHKQFDDYVYFESIEEAIKELKRRKEDKELQKTIQEFFREIGIPKQFQDDPPLVMFRQVATPNIETSRFIMIADGLDMKPIVLEYHQDKFTSNNIWKRYLAKLAFYEGIGKKGGAKIFYKNIIDFNTYDGERLIDINTLWGENLINFHHRLFFENYKHIDSENFFEASEWFRLGGLNASDYYYQFLALFISNGILLENFALDNEEYHFTKNVFLPNFKKITDYFGIKPIIVALSPTDIEDAEFWSCQNHKTKDWFEHNVII